MNNQFENQSPLLIEAGLKLTRQYDQQFYGPNKKFNETITMSDRDVIYVTRGIYCVELQLNVQLSSDLCLPTVVLSWIILFSGQPLHFCCPSSSLYVLLGHTWQSSNSLIL